MNVPRITTYCNFKPMLSRVSLASAQISCFINFRNTRLVSMLCNNDRVYAKKNDFIFIAKEFYGEYQNSEALGEDSNHDKRVIRMRNERFRLSSAKRLLCAAERKSLGASELNSF